jgi:endonuclease-3
MLEKKTINKILKILETHYGNTSTGLEFGTTYQLLISTILSAQATDVQVNKVTKKIFYEYPDPQSIIILSQNDLENTIRQIGLYKNKAKNILAATKMLLEEYNGKVPNSREELMKLPGVGRKTANVVLSVGFNHDAIAVDTHVFRVSNRIGLTKAKDVHSTELQLMNNIPKSKWSAAHHWLIWHGRNICKAQNPKCTVCPIKNHCKYYKTQI